MTTRAREAVIVGAVRTPSGRGRAGGALHGLHPVDLLSAVLGELVERTGVAPESIDDVIGGCVSQYGEQSQNLTRHAVLAAGFPHGVPATTIDRQCGSSQQAVHFAAQGVVAGVYDVAIACGVEMMSRVPMVSGFQGDLPLGRTIFDRYPDGMTSQGIAADLVADRYGQSREQLDAYAAQSHARAAHAQSEGLFCPELMTVQVPGEAGEVSVSADETIRPTTTVESLARLDPVFVDDASRARFPEVDWKVTAGSSSPLTDGASAVLVVERSVAERMGLRARARFLSGVVVGDDPIMMLTGVIPATTKALDRSGLSIDDIDAFEVNEAFASVVLAWLAETKADSDRVNPRGGAIALGHALGSSGTRLLTTLLHTLESTGGRRGLQTMCESGGLANATVIELI